MKKSDWMDTSKDIKRLKEIRQTLLKQLEKTTDPRKILVIIKATNSATILIKKLEK